MVFGLLAKLPSIVALRSPLRVGLAMAEDYPRAGVAVSEAEGRRPPVEAAISLEGVQVRH